MSNNADADKWNRPDIAAIRARADAATSGPLRVHPVQCSDQDGEYCGTEWWILDGEGNEVDAPNEENDAIFFAHARDDVLDLCDHVERLRAELDRERRAANVGRALLRLALRRNGRPGACVDGSSHDDPWRLRINEARASFATREGAVECLASLIDLPEADIREAMEATTDAPR